MKNQVATTLVAVFLAASAIAGGILARGGGAIGVLEGVSALLVGALAGASVLAGAFSRSPLTILARRALERRRAARRRGVRVSIGSDRRQPAVGSSSGGAVHAA